MASWNQRNKAGKDSGIREAALPQRCSAGWNPTPGMLCSLESRPRDALQAGIPSQGARGKHPALENHELVLSMAGGAWDPQTQSPPGHQRIPAGHEAQQPRETGIAPQHPHSTVTLQGHRDTFILQPVHSLPVPPPALQGQPGFVTAQVP